MNEEEIACITPTGAHQGEHDQEDEAELERKKEGRLMKARQGGDAARPREQDHGDADRQQAADRPGQARRPDQQRGIALPRAGDVEDEAHVGAGSLNGLKIARLTHLFD